MNGQIGEFAGDWAIQKLHTEKGVVAMYEFEKD